MSKNTRNRILLTALAALLLVTLTIGGTLAWLVDTTGTVENTFAPSKVDVDLKETTGTSYQKDPSVTVVNDVDAYVFVKVEKAGVWPANHVSYDMAAGWQLVDGTTDVYWRLVGAEDTTKTFDVILNNTITVAPQLTNEDMVGMYAEGAEEATLTITAYACQKEGFVDAAAAWTEAQKAEVFGVNTIPVN